MRGIRELGFSLDEIRRLLQLAEKDAASCGGVQVVTLDHLAEVRRKIADLQRLERILSEAAEQCEGGTAPECPILEALSGGY